MFGSNINIGSLFVLVILGANDAVSAQAANSESSSFSWMTLLVIFILIAGLAVLIFFRFRKQAGPADAKAGILKLKTTPVREIRPPKVTNRVEYLGPNSQDKAQQTRIASNKAASFSKTYATSSNITDLPIAKITELEQPPNFSVLPMSEDEDLFTAIDELQDDTDTEAEFRLVALRVLATFKTANSVEALAQIALYDLSTTLRSKAVLTLADFDHESVFDTVVLACADPSREVRAAASRALVKLSFDRAEAWARLGFSDDQLQSRQIARAAVEAGLVERSFDRLVLHDEKAAYEAFALVYLLIKTNETEKIFDAIRNHRDLKIRIALLHCMKIANNPDAAPSLNAFIDEMPKPLEVAVTAREVLRGLNVLLK